MIDKKKGIDFLTTDWILAQFDEKNKFEAKRRYREFVQKENNEEKLQQKIKAQIILGGRGFEQKIRKLMSGKLEIKEIPRQQRQIGRKGLADILKVKSDKSILAAYQYGYRMREIADELGVHYSTVSRAIKKAERG